MGNLKVLRLLGLSEGVSYLLLGLTMYLKYKIDMPKPNLIVGMAHGILFIAFCLFVLIVGKEKRWSFVTIFLALLSSLVPFGTFIADAKIFRKQN